METIYDEIVSIEEVGEMETIDITTDGNHLFFCNDILTHNSGWDTSDVSMSHVSESAGIVHTVDYLGVLWQQDGDREANRLNHTILKNRFGGMVGKNMEMYLDYTNLKITDMERTEEEVLSVTEELDNDLNELEEL